MIKYSLLINTLSNTKKNGYQNTYIIIIKVSKFVLNNIIWNYSLLHCNRTFLETKC